MGQALQPRQVRMTLEVDGIDTSYGETQVLFSISLAIAANQVFALLGPNGAGKTTTIRSILGLTPPRRGTIRFNGTDITRWPTHRIARYGIAWVPDNRRLCPTLTVAKNLQIAVKRTKYRAWSLDEVFRIFSPLEHLLHREAENLSGGEMQMVAISRALVGSPGLVLFDEPSQGLAPKIVGDMLATVRRLKSEGIAALIVEQNAEVALSVADRAAVLDRGRVAWTGNAEELLRDHALRQRLLGT
jgi:branched-chain amino acid transport system ATP-binding protein